MAWHDRVLDRSAEKTEWYRSNPDTGEFCLWTEWHGLEGIAEDCKEDYRSRFHDDFSGQTFHHVARIPLCVIEQEIRQTGKNPLVDPDHLRWMVNRDDLQAFRTRPGKV